MFYLTYPRVSSDTGVYFKERIGCNMRNKLLVLLVFVFVFVTAFAGCNNKDKDNNSVGTPIYSSDSELGFRYGEEVNACEDVTDL